jgi:ADP-heptose:LPS heptosyltransferase
MVRFLIVRFSSMGDIVLTTPVIRCLKQQVEDAEIHFLTKSRYIRLLQENPYIDKLHVLDKSFNSMIRELKEENIDYIIDLHRNQRTFLLKIALKRMSFSFKKLNFKKWLLVNFHFNKLPAIHIVDRYLETTRAFSVKNDGSGLDYFIPKGEEVDLSKITGGQEKNLIILVTGGGHQTKQIPEEKILYLLNLIESPVILLGGHEDSGKASRIMAKVTRDGVFNLTGKLSVNQSASVIRQARLIITPDTGLMHIASAFHKDIFSVWGNTVPAFGMFPFKPGVNSNIFEVNNLKCRPCSKIGYKKCPRGHFKCMMNQDFDQLASEVKKLITMQGNGNI